MPSNVGTVTLDATLDFRKATAAYNRFQRTINQKGRRDNLFSGISDDAKQFESSLGKATNRVVAFAAAAALFQGISKATSAFAASIIEVDQSLAKINVNLGQSSEGLKKFGADLFNIARQTGQTFDVAASAAEELARQGLSAEETTKRLRDALILSRIAGLDSASAVETLTAAINSFNQEALTSTEVVNKFAAVDTKFAVSSKDLAEAVSRVGSTAQSAGVGINELIGLVTSLQQTTARGGATIGNGLKTIFTRVQAAPETVAALQSVGVAIKNTDGSLRDAISILRDYGAARQRVGEVERASLDRTVAGTFQINILKAALADLGKQYSVYNSALSTSANATDEAIRKNEQLNQTLDSLINATSLSIKQLFASIGSQDLGPIFQSFFKSFEQARQFFSGESGSELGKSLGQGILKGISNVISGPALVALAVILAQAFKKVLSTIGQEARTLLTINSAASARANIQRQINSLIDQATVAELASLRAASGVLAQKEAILAIQARINQAELAGTTIARAFTVPGRGNVGFRPDSRLGSGFIGNFADPLGKAISREKAAGVPSNQIYVDRDPRVANFANPQGLLIANKRDEPLGGYQGVNRVLAQGGNPKTAGTTPNFAAPFSRADFSSRGQFVPQTTIDSLNKLFASLKGLDSNRIKTVAVQIRSLTEDFNKGAKGIVTGNLLSAQAAARRGEGKIIGASYSPSPTEVRRPSTGQPYVIPQGTVSTIPTDLLSTPETNNRTLTNAQILAAREKAVRQATLRGRLNVLVNARKEVTARQTEEARIKTEAKQEKRAQFGRNVSLGAAFALPLAAGFVEPGFKAAGIGTKGGTSGGVAAGILSGAANGAGIGGIFGPLGLAIGGVGGGLVGAISKASKSFEELSNELGEARALESTRIEQIVTYTKIQEQLNEALSTGDSKLALKLSGQRDALIHDSKTTPETRGLIGQAGGDLNKLEQLIADQQKTLQKNSTNDEFLKALNQFTDLGSHLAGNDKDEIKNLVSAIVNQAESKGINLNSTKTDNPAQLRGLFKALGNDDFAIDRSHVTKALNEVVKQARDEFAKLNNGTKFYGRTLKEFQASIVNTTESIRKAGVFDASTGVRTRGGIARNQLRGQSASDELSGLATSSQQIGLRGRSDVSQAIDSGREQRLQLEEAFRSDLRTAFKGLGSLSQDQQQTAFSGATSTKDLTDLARGLSSGGEADSFTKLIKDYEAEIEKNIEATKESVRTIELKTELEKKASEIIRRQTAYSGGSRTNGSDEARGLAVFGPGERTPRRQASENAAFTDFFERQKSLGANTDALQGLYNTSSAKDNLQKFLTEAEAIIKSSTLNQGRARDEAGNLSVSATRTAATTLSHYKDPTKAAIGRTLLDNLSALQDNVTAAGQGQARIKGALSSTQSLRPEELINKQLEATTALNKSLDAFSNASKDFTISINAKVDLLNSGIDQVQTENFRVNLQSQITSLVNQVMALKGKPMPPSPSYQGIKISPVQ